MKFDTEQKNGGPANLRRPLWRQFINHHPWRGWWILHQIIFLLTIILPVKSLFPFTDSYDIVGKNKFSTYLVYDPVLWPDHWKTSKHSFIKPGIKFGITQNIEVNGNFTFYEYGVLEYFLALKYKMPYSNKKCIQAINVTFNHMFNKKIENLDKDYGWRSPFQEPSEKNYWRGWNTHFQYHIGYKINKTFEISINMGIQYEASITRKSRRGFAPAMSFPALHINITDKMKISLSYGDGDSGDVGLIGISNIWN